MDDVMSHTLQEIESQPAVFRSILWGWPVGVAARRAYRLRLINFHRNWNYAFRNFVIGPNYGATAADIKPQINPGI